jgi:serine/threonine-protein kinase
MLILVFSGCLTTNETQPTKENLTDYAIGDQETFTLYSTEDYTIQYPSDWNTTIIAGTGIPGFLSPLEGESDDFRENVNVVFVDLPNKQIITLEDLIVAEEDVSRKLITDYKLISSEKTTVNGNNAYKRTITSRQGKYVLKQQQIIILRDNREYVLTYSATPSGYDRFYKTAGKIMYSFTLK